MADRQLSIDTRKYEVSLDGQKVPTTYTEFELLRILRSADGGVLSRQQIARRAWRGRPKPDSRTVDQHVARLRRKIGRNFISTIPKRGYSFVG